MFILKVIIDHKKNYISNITFTSPHTKDIKNQKCYNVEVSRSALESCDTIGYGDVKIKRSGINKIFIGNNASRLRYCYNRLSSRLYLAEAMI